MRREGRTRSHPTFGQTSSSAPTYVHTGQAGRVRLPLDRHLAERKLADRALTRAEYLAMTETETEDQ